MQIKALRAHKPGTARRLELVKAQAGGEDSLYVYGTIGDLGYGDGITAQDFARALSESTAGKLRLRINSPGGDVFEGVAMAQAIREYAGEVIAQVDGIAASAATFLTTTANQTVMAPGSMLMIHCAWTLAMGNAEDLLKQAALLEKIDGQIATQYGERMHATKDEALALMRAETWFTESEAVEAGLADSVTDTKGGKTEARALASKWNVGEVFERTPSALTFKAADDTAAEPHHEFERVQRLARLL
jgi:ATP-dependent Clp protease protease subunit